MGRRPKVSEELQTPILENDTVNEAGNIDTPKAPESEENLTNFIGVPDELIQQTENTEVEDLLEDEVDNDVVNKLKDEIKFALDCCSLLDVQVLTLKAQILDILNKY